MVEERGWLARYLAHVRQRGWREIAFLVGVWLKGFDGVLELIGGAALLLTGPSFLLHAVRLLTQDEIAEDPDDLIANYLRHTAARLSVTGKHFMALYLLIHGVIKIGLVWALLERILVAYPIAIVAFAAFIIYQLYRYSLMGGAGLLWLTALDAVVIALVWLEFRTLRGKAS